MFESTSKKLGALIVGASLAVPLTGCQLEAPPHEPAQSSAERDFDDYALTILNLQLGHIETAPQLVHVDAPDPIRLDSDLQAYITNQRKILDDLERKLEALESSAENYHRAHAPSTQN